MTARFTLSEAELRRAVVEWLENNSEVAGNEFEVLVVTFTSYNENGLTVITGATVEIVEVMP